MFIWSLVLFGLGIIAVLDSQFNYGYVFRSASSIVFMLVSLGVLVRTRALQKSGFRERLLESYKELKTQVEGLKHPQTPVEEWESKQELNV